jgi:hypothetical protein
MKKQFKQVSHSLGKNLNFGSFSGKQAIVLAGVFSFTFLFTYIILGLSIYIGLGASTWSGLTCAFLSGSKPHKFWSRIYPPVPNWVRGQARYVSPIYKTLLGSKRAK